jgi:hypothetical protein
MIRSETFKEFASAFAKFQADVQNPKLTAENPHFRSRYAPLSEVLNTVRPILAKHGLSVFQDVATEEDKVVVTTVLLHESGEYLQSSPLKIPAGRGGKPADAQGIGSATSYGKRYQLQAAIGVAADEDNDGEEFTQHNTPYSAPMPTQGPTKEVLAVKFQLGTGSREGFENYYDEQIAQGRDHIFIDAALDKALEKKKKQKTA